MRARAGDRGRPGAGPPPGGASHGEGADRPAGAAEALTSPLLARAGFAHAFFTRRGGVGRAPWDTLSFTVSSGDEPEAVAENRARAARVLGVSPARLYYLSQVHGVASVQLAGDEDPDEVVRRVGDVTLSRVGGVACGVRSADCVPVLVGDRASGAAVAVHSGWRGTVQDVVSAAVAALRRLVGEQRLEPVAAIGPHIETCCFEVGPEVAEQLAAASSRGAAAVVAGQGRPHVDLRAVIHAQLEGAGVAPADVDDVRGCTVCDAERFFSFRRDGQRSGRLLSAIVAGRRPGAG